MVDHAATAAISATIQSAVAPVFLLAGLGGIMNVISTRLARAIDRTRILETLHANSTGREHALYVSELRVLDRRISFANRATSLCVASALVVCLVVTLLLINQLASFNLGELIAVLFVVAMLLLSGGLICFLVEIQIAVGSLRVRKELLERTRH
jgi:hypothetical protein